MLTHFDFVEILKTRLMQAELDWSTAGDVGNAAGSTIAFLLFWKFVPMWAALLIAAAVGFAPYGYILRVRRKRFDRFREGFPDVRGFAGPRVARRLPAFDRDGHGGRRNYAHGGQGDSQDGCRSEPGNGLDRVLENMGRRLPLLEVNLFASAVQLHSRTGGKLSEVMGSLAENMRERIPARRSSFPGRAWQAHRSHPDGAAHRDRHHDDVRESGLHDDSLQSSVART